MGSEELDIELAHKAEEGVRLLSQARHEVRESTGRKLMGEMIRIRGERKSLTIMVRVMNLKWDGRPSITVCRMPEFVLSWLSTSKSFLGNSRVGRLGEAQFG